MLGIVGVLLCSCSASTPTPPTASSPTPAAQPAPAVSTNAEVCAFMSHTPRARPDTRLLWAQVNTGAALEEVLAVGWQPGLFQVEAERLPLQAEQLYNTLPVAAELVRLRPGVDDVVVTFLGTNLKRSYKTVYTLPASVMRSYQDTPEGRNVVQQVMQRNELVNLPAIAGPGELAKVDSDGDLLSQC